MARPHRLSFDTRLAEFRQRSGLTQQQVADAIGISAEMVRRHERGTALPIPLYRQKYCEIYASNESDLWIYESNRWLSGNPRLEAAASQAALLNPGETLFPAIPPAADGYVDADYLGLVRGYIQSLVSLDNRFGGGDLVRLAVRFFASLQIRINAGLISPQVAREVNATAGELAEVVGWIAYDADQHDLVRRMNQESLYYTRLAGDRSIELLTLQNASMHAGALGRPTEALQLARSVLEGDYKISPRVRALFLTREARARAQLGDESAVSMFKEVNSLFLEGVNEGDPAWAWWVDERELAWHEAMAQRDLKRPDLAIGDFERSVEATRVSETRSQYLHRSYLLQAQLDTGSWADIESTIASIMPLVSEVASCRTVAILRNAISRIAAQKSAPGTVVTAVTRLGISLDALAL